MADTTWNPYEGVEWLFGNSDNSATFMSVSTSPSSTTSDITDEFALTFEDAADFNRGPLFLDDCSMKSLSSPGNTSLMDYLEVRDSCSSCNGVTTPEAIQGDAPDGMIAPLHCDISVVEEVNQVPVTMMAISPKTPSPLFFQLNQIGISNALTSGGEYQVICPFNMGVGFQNTDQSVPNEDIKPDINAINVKVEAPDASYPSFDIVASHHNYCAFKPIFTAGPTAEPTVPIKVEPCLVPSFQNERRRKQVLSSSSSKKIKTPTKRKAEAITTTTTMRKVRLYEYTTSDIENSGVKDKGKLRSRVARAVNTKRFHDKVKFQLSTLTDFFQEMFKKPRQKKKALSILRGAPHIMNEFSTHCPELFERLLK